MWMLGQIPSAEGAEEDDEGVDDRDVKVVDIVGTFGRLVCFMS